MEPMLVFVDCEFTDFVNIDLISIALVCEDGREFYAERSNFRRDECSDFVRVAVLPLLGADSSRVMTRSELSAQLRTWIAELPAIKLACDSSHDRDLFADAMDYTSPPNIVGWLNLNSLSGEEEVRFNTAVAAYHDNSSHPWHHALHDARALQMGWRALRNPV